MSRHTTRQRLDALAHICRRALVEQAAADAAKIVEQLMETGRFPDDPPAAPEVKDDMEAFMRELEASEPGR